MKTQKINHRTLALYINGVINSSKAIEMLNMACASLVLGKNANEDFDSYLQREPQAMQRFKNIVAAKNFFMSNPSIEQARVINGYNGI